MAIAQTGWFDHTALDKAKKKVKEVKKKRKTR